MVRPTLPLPQPAGSRRKLARSCSRCRPPTRLTVTQAFGLKRLADDEEAAAEAADKLAGSAGGAGSAVTLSRIGLRMLVVAPLKASSGCARG